MLTYATWDGPGARYLRSLYLPLLSRLGVPVRVIQATYGELSEIAATRKAANELGIQYEPISFERRRARVGLLDGGTRLLLKLRSRTANEEGILMVRSLVPAFAALVANVPSSRLIFDADGLVADERAEFSGWKRHGFPYRAAREIERQALRRSVVTVTRTRAAERVLRSRGGRRDAHIVVAGNGTDEQRFIPLPAERRERERERLGIAATDTLVVYCGSIGPQYHPDCMAAFVRALRRESTGATHFLVISTAAREAKELLASAGCDLATGHHRSLGPEDVPSMMALADVGLGFRTPSLSQSAVAPIKVGEYLLTGVPVIANLGIGDLEEQLRPSSAVVVPRPTIENAEKAATKFVEQDFDIDEVRATGIQYFTLASMASGYKRAIELALS